MLRAEGRGRAVAREVDERREGREEDDGEERPAGARGRSFGLARGRRGARQCRREAEQASRQGDTGTREMEDGRRETRTYSLNTVNRQIADRRSVDGRTDWRCGARAPAPRNRPYAMHSRGG